MNILHVKCTGSSQDGHARVQGLEEMVEQEDWREKRLGRPEALRSLKHYLWAQILGHHMFSTLGTGGGGA